MRLGFADLLGVVCGAYVIALSLSKAAFIAGSLLVATISITCGWRRGVWLVLAAIITLGLTLEVARGGLGAEITEMNFISHLEKRLSGIGEQKDDSLLHRGYIRLLRNPQYLVLGAGEGAFERLTDEAFDKEFHSTLGNVLMSYGILGLVILVGLFFLIFWDADLTDKASSVPHRLLFPRRILTLSASRFAVQLRRTRPLPLPAFPAVLFGNPLPARFM